MTTLNSYSWGTEPMKLNSDPNCYSSTSHADFSKPYYSSIFLKKCIACVFLLFVPCLILLNPMNFHLCDFFIEPSHRRIPENSPSGSKSPQSVAPGAVQPGHPDPTQPFDAMTPIDLRPSPATSVAFDLRFPIRPPLSLVLAVSSILAGAHRLTPLPHLFIAYFFRKAFCSYFR